jgi:ABC-type transporter MlaC component
MKIGGQQKIAVLLALIVLSMPIPALAGEPLELLKTAADRVIAVLKDPRLKSAEQKKERVEQLKAIINPIIDYEEVARRTLAAHCAVVALRSRKSSPSFSAPFWIKYILC